MRIAAYQAPLRLPGSMDAVDGIRERVRWCESASVAILCCPEAILGGLADYAPDPSAIALSVSTGHLAAALAPLASEIGRAHV